MATVKTTRKTVDIPTHILDVITIEGIGKGYRVQKRYLEKILTDHGQKILDKKKKPENAS